MVAWKAADLQANGIKLHYHRTGGNKPPLVLAHGLTDNGLCWTPIAQALEADYDLIMLDARGHGRSDVPAQGYTDADHAADYAGAIQALGLTKPALLGHSMGAATIAYLAAHEPEMVSCILLEDPPWRLGPPPEVVANGPSFAENWRNEVIRRHSLSAEQILAEGHKERPMWSEAEFAPWVLAKQQVSPNAIDYASTRSTPWTTYVADIVCPTLLIRGAAELGGIITDELAREAVRLNPRIQAAHIAGAGHSIRREQFDAYVAAVRQFLVAVYA